MPALADSVDSRLPIAGSSARPCPLSMLGFNALLSFGFEPGDVRIEFVSIDAPYSALADLEGHEFPIAHQGIDLADSDVEVLSDFVRREKSRRN